MLSGLLPDSQISASSMRDLHAPMGVARLVASRSGWFPSLQQPVAREEWLQVDLGVAKAVRGVITQGARGMDGGVTSESRAYVRKYRLAHSLNGKDWTFIMDTKTNMPKVRALTHTHAHTHSGDVPLVLTLPQSVVARWSVSGQCC